MCWVGHRLTHSDDVRDWQTLRRLLRTHSLVTTRLPLEDGRVIEIRKPSRPDAGKRRFTSDSESIGKKPAPLENLS